MIAPSYYIPYIQCHIKVAYVFTGPTKYHLLKIHENNLSTIAFLHLYILINPCWQIFSDVVNLLFDVQIGTLVYLNI